MLLWLPGDGWEDETTLHPQEIHWISVLEGSHSMLIPDLHNPFGHTILLILLKESFCFLEMWEISLYCSLLHGYICSWELIFCVYRLCIWIEKTIMWLSGYILFISLFPGHLKIRYIDVILGDMFLMSHYFFKMQIMMWNTTRLL